MNRTISGTAPEDTKNQSAMGKILYDSGDYRHAAECFQSAVEHDPEDWYAYTLLSLSQFRLHRDVEAFSSAQRALRLRPDDRNLYLIQIQILLRGGAWERVRAALDELRQQGLPEDAPILWCRGQLAEFADKNAKEALRLYQAAAQGVEAGENMLWASQLYYRMARLMGRLPEAEADRNGNMRLAVLEKGLAHDALDEDCLDYKGWLLKTSGRTQEALDMFLALEEKPYHPLVVERNLAELYYETVNTHAPEALSYYEKLLRVRPNGDYCYYAGCCKRIMGDYEGAEEYHLQEIALAPEDVDGYNGLAYALEAQGRKEEALVQIDRALAAAEEQGRFFAFLYEHKIRILCRMNRWEDALETAELAMQSGQYPEGYQCQFDSCIQFGKWEAAGQVLDRWCQDQGQTPQWMLASGRLCQFRGELEQAERIMEQAAPLLPREDVQDFRLVQADLTCDTARLLELWDSQQKEHPHSSYYLIHLAFNQWQAGNRRAAKATAGKALKLLEDSLRDYSTVELLYRARRILALAIAGRERESREELALARRLPLCEHCQYCACKDADIFEAMAEEVCGHRQRALELYRRGAARWPDEMNFRAGVIRTQEEA